MVIFFKQSCRLVSFRCFFQVDDKVEEIPFSPNERPDKATLVIHSIAIFLILSSFIFSQTGVWNKTNGHTCKGLAILSDSLIFAITSVGLEYTSDYGKTWFEKPTPSSINYLTHFTINDFTNSIFIYDSEAQIIYKSTDKGNNWIISFEHIPSVTHMVSKYGNIYTTSYTGQLYMSIDDGNSWDSSFVATNLRSVDVSSFGQIYTITGNAQIFTSKDHGKTWRKLIYQNSDTFTSSFLINKDEIICEYSKGIIISKDFGTSWTYRAVPIVGPYYRSIAIDKDNNLYYWMRVILKSSDSGLNWTIYGGQFYTFNGMVGDDNDLYVATNEGIYHYDQSMPIYVGNNYFPFHLGNTWQYLSYSSSMRDPNNYELVEDRITRDTIINNYKYYSYRSYWVRYSEVDKKIFIRDGDSDKIYMTFNLPPSGAFQRFDGRWESLAAVIDGSKNLFNDTVKFKGYESGNLMNGKQSESFGENVGLIEYSYDVNIGPDFSAGRYLMMAVIYDSTNTPRYLSNHYKPEINLTPINFISTSEFQINFKVNHKYSRIYDPINPFKTVNFIHSVYMVSNYSKGDSVINKNTLFALNTEKTKKYLISSIIDTTLLKDGFTFNYKIIAKDKGIIPETSSSPDTGYYQIKWGTTSVDDIKNEVIGFNLGQNYPNPFNPSSVIKYSVPVEGKVMLRVYNILGTEITTLVNSQKQMGQYEVLFDGSNLPSGIYFYRLQLGKLIQTKKMILLK